ncbi:MAG: ATP-binding protein [Solirubrobacteraceae bacterium]|nr:ATP-binding protein [Solirubrobacteraceae bacterium]
MTNLDANLEAGNGLWFEGTAGTGKTSLATVVSLAAREAGRSFAIYSVPRILNELRRTFDDDSTVGNLELIDRLTAVELLQLDDLGSERTNPWVLEQLYALIDARYEAQRSVIVTTNLDRDQLIEQVGARVVSRLSEMCELILVYGEDHRAKSDEWATASAPRTPPAHRPIGSPAQAPVAPSSAAWQSPADAANLHRPEWPSPEAPPIYARPAGDRSTPPEGGLQGSTRRSGSDA